MTESKSPDFQANKNILNFISYCEAIEVALGDTIFYKAYQNPEYIRTKQDEITGKNIEIGNIYKLELAYDDTKNNWNWILYTEPVFEGDTNKRYGRAAWLGKKIIINAHNKIIGKIVDYQEIRITTPKF